MSGPSVVQWFLREFHSVEELSLDELLGAASVVMLRALLTQPHGRRLARDAHRLVALQPVQYNITNHR